MGLKPTDALATKAARLRAEASVLASLEVSVMGIPTNHWEYCPAHKVVGT